MEEHRWPSTWARCSGMKLYQAFQQYGIENFTFEVIEETDNLKEQEQYFIDLLKPSYNIRRARYRDIEKSKETQSERYKRICSYNGETLTLAALAKRFQRAGIDHPVSEAKKYLLAE